MYLKLKTAFKNLSNHSLFINIIILLIRLYLWIIFHTCKITLKVNSDSEKILQDNTLCFLAVWHGRLLPFPKLAKRYGKYTAIVSLHKDGNFIDKFITSYGHNSVRGSSKKGSYTVTRKIIKCIEENKSIVFTPDGPRGPKYKAKTIIPTLAYKKTIPIITLCYSSKKSIILKTWDSFMIPTPFTELIIEIGAPINVSSNNSDELGVALRNRTRNLDKLCGVTID